MPALFELRPLKGGMFRAESGSAIAIVRPSSRRPTLSINAYGGGLIRPSYMYSPIGIIVDLKGLRAAEHVAILLDHQREQIIGQAPRVNISESRIDCEALVTGDLDDPQDPAYKVCLHARNGFVWKASIGIEPERYEKVEAGDFTEQLNGGNVAAGPCYILRAGLLQEISLLSTAADAGTSVALNQ